MNQSDLGDWKQDESIGLNAIPIYDVRMTKTENTIVHEEIETKEMVPEESVTE